MYPRRVWSTNEDKVLRDAIGQIGWGRWKEISVSRFPERTPRQIMNRARILKDDGVERKDNVSDGSDATFKNPIIEKYQKSEPDEEGDGNLVIEDETESLPSNEAVDILEESTEDNLEEQTIESRNLREKSVAYLNGRRKRRIRAEDGSWMNEADLAGRVISHHSLISSSIEPSPQKKWLRKSQAGQTKQLDAPYNPFHLIDPKESKLHATGSSMFTASISMDAMIMMDYHAHLSYSEVIGLLGGIFDANEKILQIRTIFPCHSIGSDIECEMDPVSEMHACELFQQQGLVLVGWYHSHPTFRPSPSLRDIETQTSYQLMMENPIEPFVGIIISPYIGKSGQAVSLVEVIHISKELEENQSYRIPIKVSWNVSYAKDLAAHEVKAMFETIKPQLERLKGRYLENEGTLSKKIDYHAVIEKVCKRYRERHVMGGGSTFVQDLYNFLVKI